MAKSSKPKTVPIRADNGQFASKDYQKKHPDKVENVKVHPKTKK